MNIDGLTRAGTGNPLPGCLVHLMRTDNDVLRDRTISNLAGQYNVTPYDTTAHYVTAVKPGTCDSTLYTADCTFITIDTSGEVAGATVNGLFGI